jgi:L,D-transpeptidase ErfK/SrfK
VRALYIYAVAAAMSAHAGQAPPRYVGNALTTAVVDYVVSPGDTFETIAHSIGSDPLLLARRNTRWVHSLLKTGMKLTIEARVIVPAGVEHGLVVNIAQRQLFFIAGDGVARNLPIAVGQPGWPTPLGPFRVLRKELNPVWIGLSLPIDIDGTRAPAAASGFTTYGCIRLGADDIRTLFDAVPVGGRGEIVYEPALLWTDGVRQFAEVHPDRYHWSPDALSILEAGADYLGVRSRIDWRRAEEVARRRDGVAIDVTLR